MSLQLDLMLHLHLLDLDLKPLDLLLGRLKVGDCLKLLNSSVLKQVQEHLCVGIVFRILATTILKMLACLHDA